MIKYEACRAFSCLTILDSIYHMALYLIFNRVFCRDNANILPYIRDVLMGAII